MCVYVHVFADTRTHTTTHTHTMYTHTHHVHCTQRAGNNELMGMTTREVLKKAIEVCVRVCMYVYVCMRV